MLTIEKKIKINASIQKIWAILTEPEWTKKYMFGCIPVTDWKPGSPILWKGFSNNVLYVKGIIFNIKPPRLLQYSTFNANSTFPDIPENYLLVTLQLEQENEYAVLSLSNGDFAKVDDGEKRYEDALENWAMVLNKLKMLAEGSA